MNDVGIRTINRVEVNIKHVNDLRRCIRRCPAVMFATSRTDNVIGRIKFLTISIKTIIGIKGKGDPIGTI